MDYSTPGFPVHHQLPEPAQSHVHHFPLSVILIACAIEIRQIKEIEDIHIGMKEVKLPLLPDDTIVYTENPTEYTKQLIERTNKSSKITRSRNLFCFCILENEKKIKF